MGGRGNWYLSMAGISRCNLVVSGRCSHRKSWILHLLRSILVQSESTLARILSSMHNVNPMQSRVHINLIWLGNVFRTHTKYGFRKGGWSPSILNSGGVWSPPLLASFIETYRLIPSSFKEDIHFGSTSTSSMTSLSFKFSGVLLLVKLDVSWPSDNVWVIGLSRSLERL